ncbi:hypothetical protein Trydic_g20565 [Trypoxylus dichotomus]
MASLYLIVLILSTVSALPSQGRVKRVINGVSTPIEDVPYQVALVVNNFPICCGSIIRSNVVITAAHCVCGYLPNDTLVYAGMYNKIEDMPKLKGIQIKDVKVHELYNFTGEATPDDIALIVLEEDLVFGPTIAKIDLIEEEYDIPVNATVSGWGSTNCNFSLSDEDACNGWYSIELQSGTLTISKRENKLIYSPHTRVTGNYGDSGGPIVAYNKLIGISRNCDIVEPDIFDFDATSVLDYLDWIKETLDTIK